MSIAVEDHIKKLHEKGEGELANELLEIIGDSIDHLGPSIETEQDAEVISKDTKSAHLDSETEQDAEVLSKDTKFAHLDSETGKMKWAIGIVVLGVLFGSFAIMSYPVYKFATKVRDSATIQDIVLMSVSDSPAFLLALTQHFAAKGDHSRVRSFSRLGLVESRSRNFLEYTKIFEDFLATHDEVVDNVGYILAMPEVPVSHVRSKK